MQTTTLIGTIIVGCYLTIQINYTRSFIQSRTKIQFRSIYCNCSTMFSKHIKIGNVCLFVCQLTLLMERGWHTFSCIVWEKYGPERITVRKVRTYFYSKFTSLVWPLWSGLRWNALAQARYLICFYLAQTWTAVA